MEVISKILMAIFNLVVQFIGFIVLFYMLCFAVLCIFTHSNKSNTAYAQHNSQIEKNSFF